LGIANEILNVGPIRRIELRVQMERWKYGSGDYPLCYLVGIWDFSSEAKRPGRKSEHSAQLLIRLSKSGAVSPLSHIPSRREMVSFTSTCEKLSYRQINLWHFRLYVLIRTWPPWPNFDYVSSRKRSSFLHHLQPEFGTMPMVQKKEQSRHSSRHAVVWEENKCSYVDC